MVPPVDPENPDGSECGICELFKCPGWDEFVGELYNIAAFAVGKVEAPPVPDIPRPKMPNIFEILNDVDQRNPVKPTGQDGIGDTAFDASDIKDQAPEIPVREDPTGGFNIVDPLSTLPEDGSTAPRPEEELEKLPYPNGSGVESDGLPKPSGSGNNDGKVPIPDNPGGTANPSDTGGAANYPIP